MNVTSCRHCNIHKYNVSKIESLQISKIHLQHKYNVLNGVGLYRDIVSRALDEFSASTGNSSGSVQVLQATVQQVKTVQICSQRPGIVPRGSLTVNRHSLTVNLCIWNIQVYNAAKATGIRCTNNVIHTVTGRIAIGYNRNKSLPVLLASGCVFSFRFISKTRFCAVGIEPSTRRTRRQIGSSGKAPRAAKVPTMATEAMGIRMSLTNPTVPSTLLSIGSRGRMARNHCKDFLRPSASATLCGVPTGDLLESGKQSNDRCGAGTFYNKLTQVTPGYIRLHQVMSGYVR